MSIEEVCRVCEGNHQLEFIYDGENPNLAEKLMICANVEVEYEDTLPKYICLKCHKNLDFVYLFRIQCQETDRKLRELLISKSCVLQKKDELDNSKSTFEKPSDNLLGSESETKPEEEYLLEEYEDIEELVEDEDEDEDEIKSNGRFNTDNENEEIILYDVITPLEDVEYNSEVESFIKEEQLEDRGKHGSEKRIETNSLENRLYLINEAYSDGEDKYIVEELFNVTNKSDFSKKSNNIGIEYDIDANTKENEDEKDGTKARAHADKIFRCDTCGESFNTFSEFNVHKKSHGDHRYQCPVCMKWFSKRYRLKNHMAIHEESKSFCCEVCGNKYTNQGNLDRHIRHFHNKERPYMCTECGQSFSRSNILKLHYTVHMSERNYECEVCNKRFKAEYYLNLHKKSHIPIEERPPRSRKIKPANTQHKISITCSYCGKKSASRALHLSHIRIHTGEKPFECKTCSRKFAFRQSLKSHELLHTGEKPYRCELCGLTFRQIGHLKGHMLVHSGVKKHKCQFCDKAFGLKSNLVVHQRLHTGETPYHCNLCNRKFYDSNGLKRHKHSHLKKKKELQEIQEIENLVHLDQMNTYFEKEEYGEIIEMQTDEEIRLVDLGECNQEGS